MIDFPTNPAVDTIVTAPNGTSWKWSGAQWVLVNSSSGPIPPTNAGAGLTKTGQTIDVVPADGSLVVAADSVRVAAGNGLTVSPGGVDVVAADGSITVNPDSIAVANDGVTNAKLANMPGFSIKANNASYAADPVDLDPVTARTLLQISAPNAEVAGIIMNGYNYAWQWLSQSVRLDFEIGMANFSVQANGWASFAFAHVFATPPMVIAMNGDSNGMLWTPHTRTISTSVYGFVAIRYDAVYPPPGSALWITYLAVSPL